MMSFPSWVALTVFLFGNASAFVIPISVGSGSSSSVYATIDAGPVLAVPPTPEDPSFDVPAAFDRSVQTTYGRFPLTVVSGEGCRLRDDTGKEYLDFVAGIATCTLGHGSSAVTEAVISQLGKVHHVSNLYRIPGQAALARWLCDSLSVSTDDNDDDDRAKAFFCNSGAEANEAAIKLARKKAGVTDPVILTALNSFHGRTLGALSATGQTKYHKGFTYGGDKPAEGFQYVPYNDIEALGEAFREINETPSELKEAGRTRKVAAVLLEPIQGEGGIVCGTPEYFAAARQLCNDHGALLMVDEVQTGIGRTGTLWGHQNLGVSPDVVTSAKALGGGVPIGAMLATGDAADVFAPGDHASTYGGNPLACAAGLAVARSLSEGTLDNAARAGKYLGEGLAALSRQYPDHLFDEVRGWGLLRGIRIKAPLTPGQVVQEAMAQGLLLVPAGADVIRFVPPLVVTEAEIDEALRRFEKALVTVSQSSS